MRGLVLIMALSACAHAPTPPARAAQAVRLLAETPERETTALTELRSDLEVDTTDFDRTPHVVATGETSLLTAEGSDVFLSGDEAGAEGFSVDNCVFLEVLGADGRVLRSVVIGNIDGLSQGAERIDSLGPRAFRFGAGEVQLTSILPEQGAFRLRATVLDYGGVGRVSDVFVRIVPRRTSPDELRE